MRICVWIWIAAVSVLCLVGCGESKTHHDVNKIRYETLPVDFEGPLIYCVHCGIIPSPGGMKCPVTGGSHAFREIQKTKLMVCPHCGAVPSPHGTKCPVTGGSHAFREYK